MTVDAHPRQIIRKAVAQALQFKTAADDRVYTSRTTPWATKELPGLVVTTPDESVGGVDSAANVNPEASIRTLQCEVRAVVSVTDALDDELDARALEVETAMVGAQDFGISSVMSVALTETNTGIAEENGRPVGVVRLNYEIRYVATL